VTDALGATTKLAVTIKRDVRTGACFAVPSRPPWDASLTRPTAPYRDGGTCARCFRASPTQAGELSSEVGREDRRSVGRSIRLNTYHVRAAGDVEG
jgi:hypothetical protein